MNTRLYLYIAFRIVIFFSLGIAFTYVPDHLRDFFGDTPFNDGRLGEMDYNWKWGARHYWYFWMMVFLSILTIVDTFMSIVKLANKHQ